MLRVALTKSVPRTRPAWTSLAMTSLPSSREDRLRTAPRGFELHAAGRGLSVASTAALVAVTPQLHFAQATRFLSTDAGKKPVNLRRRNSNFIHEQEDRLDKALEKVGERGFQVKDLQNLDQKISQKAVSFVKNSPSMALSAAKTVKEWIRILISEPARAQAWLKETKGHISHELKHYWIGTKLLYADVTTSTRILRRVLKGNALTRRERKQLQRTVADLLRLVPFAFFVVVPFMELLLPFALKMFPNMLPSTYKHDFQREEDMKRQLQLRVSLAEFLQETVKDVMQDTRDTEGLTEEKRATAKEVMSFIERAQRGEPLSSEETLRIAYLFNDEVTLDNISRPQLVGMCRYMGVNPYGNDNFLRFQLRMKIRALKKDDQEIIWEGLDSLNKEELQIACMERGMRATGLTKAGYVKQMRQWLDLSINKNVPASLLILSRAMNITSVDNPEAALAASLSSMDEEVVTEVALAAKQPSSASAATTADKVQLKELQLESIRYQNEMIADEEKLREEAKKRSDDEATKKQEDQESKALEQEKLEMDSLLEASLDQARVSEIKNLAETLPAERVSSVDAVPISVIEQERKLTLEEVSALESLAFKSLVEKERQVMAKMKIDKTAMDVQGLLAAGRIGAVKENKTADLMLKKLDSMLSKLEVELDKVDKDVGDRLNILDRDSDGVVDVTEFKTAVMTILRKNKTEEAAEWIVSQIDEDKDGKISLEELVKWVEQKRDLLEATGELSPHRDETLDQDILKEVTTLKRTESKKGTTN
ncbi:LETM1 and EF-hand domain-containing protein 1 [Achlya hypogyna]|uniref:Mitochondrial proton/calcium exchanger protein n=1 Tax=Achlya hypogyna TaxID=1202772 RepID=A0A1V9YM45_ACHHY|nr:LETM1 and EF-hand domain-containing protein 1 [Achlya hypogyna]